MREMLYEHNRLNGFWFVLIEFVLVALAAMFLAVATLLHGSRFWFAVWCGVAVNAVAVCWTVAGQMIRGEQSQNLAESFSRTGRDRIRREHPDLGKHTLQIFAAVLVPYLLAILTAAGRPSKRHDG